MLLSKIVKINVKNENGNINFFLEIFRLFHRNSEKHSLVYSLIVCVKIDCYKSFKNNLILKLYNYPIKKAMKQVLSKLFL